MSDAWYCDTGKDGQAGPLTLLELKERLATSSNPTDVLVWRGGFPDWKLATDVPELEAMVVSPSLRRKSTTASAKGPDGSVKKILVAGGTIVVVVAVGLTGSFVLRHWANEGDAVKGVEAGKSAALNPAIPARPAPAMPPAAAARPAPAPAPQVAAPGLAAQTPQLIYSPWAKFCSKGQDPQAKQLCMTRKDGRAGAGQPVVAAALIEPEGEPKKLFRVTFPIPLQLPSGTRVIVDQQPPLTGPFFTCFPDGCMADYEATPDLIGKLKRGQILTIQAINLAGATISFAMPLVDFAKANEGPPTDPKAFEEQQKRADEARKELESGLRPSLPIR